MDTSSSLRRADPEDHRAAGAIGLVESLPAKADIQIGVVAFDKHATLDTPLTADRGAAIAALRHLDRSGSTDLAVGIRRALAGFREAARPGSSRAMLIFTDGKSKELSASHAVHRATRRAREEGVAVHSLLLGSDAKGAATLEGIASATGGSMVRVTDPTRLGEAFLNLRTAGVDTVMVQVNDAEPVPAQLTGSTFSARVPLVLGENRIVAIATSLHGQSRRDEVSVTVQDPGCAELQIEARSDGQPVLSVSDRAVEIVLDASRSMWGRMEGRPKMDVAKEILDDALAWLPQDLSLSLRAYGHGYSSAQRNCHDSELLVPLARGNRGSIRGAIRSLRPNGQTPLGYALQQVAADLRDFRGERAVVLVTDGIESCGLDPAQAARELQSSGPVPVHVIGFGLGSEADEDLASLQAIAQASGGRFLMAQSASQLREALSLMVGTSYQVWGAEGPVADGTLGSDEALRLPAGDYRVRLESAPPQDVPIALGAEERVVLLFEREGGAISHAKLREAVDYAACTAPVRIAAGPLPSATGGGDAPADAAGDEPLARRTRVLEIQEGRVEIWQNLRPDRRAEWGVVLRHPSLENGSELVWSGDDLEGAERAARGTQARMRGPAASMP
jgi:Mg-chelatase subunit ChlD